MTAPGDDRRTIVAEWLDDLRRVLADEPAVVADVRIGVFYTAVRLASGEVGVAFTPRDLSDTVCCPRTAAAAPRAGRHVGADAWALAADALGEVPLRRAVAVAVLNALSARAIDRAGVPGGRLVRGVDALEAAGVRPDDRVALVGAFVPFIRALKRRVAELWVVDKHAGALKDDEQALWRPPAAAEATLARATVVVMTGSALVEGGLDALLAAAGGARCVVLAGPTASPWPPPFFHRGIHVLGGIRVLDGDAMIRLVGEGGSGYFFDGVAEKVCLVRDGSPPAVDRPARIR
ncbi:MAG: DUF364 domain-containing protein [Candidatus Binatia bacterium]